MKTLLLFLFFIPGFLPAQDAPLEKFIDSLMAPGNRPSMPGSFLIIAKDGKPVVRKAYGMANLELDVQAKPEHLFGLASSSKQMIAVAMLQLARQGKLSLTDDIRKYLPDFDTHGKLITIEHLLTHTSGIHSESGATGAKGKTLYDLTRPYGVLSKSEFLDYVMNHELYFDPGTDWGWNPYGYFMAFFIIENVSGMPFNDYMRKNIFQPAGMTNTFSKVDGNRLGLGGIKNLLSSYYQIDPDGKWTWRDVKIFSPMEFFERYNIVTCLDDLLKWDIALREEKLLPKEWLEKAWTPYILKNGQSTNYGYGWFISSYNDVRVMATSGFGVNPTCTVLVPEKNLFIAYSQFYGGLEQAENTVKKILSHIVPLPYPSPRKAETPLRDYIGVYQIDRLGARTTSQLSDIPIYMNITTSGDTLYMQQTGTEKMMLRPAGKDKFLPARSENILFIFTRDANKKVDAITSEGTLWTLGQQVKNNRVDVAWHKPVEGKNISKDLLKQYAGTYYLAPIDVYRFFETDGHRLFERVQGKLQELIPVSENKFVRKGIEDMTFEFNTNKKGTTTLTFKSLRTIDYRKIN